MALSWHRRTVPALVELKQCIDAGSFRELVRVHPSTGELFYPDALPLLAGLPIIHPNVSLQELVQLGILSNIPVYVSEIEKTAKYKPGRQLYIKIPNGIFHHQSILVGQKEEQWQVKLEDESEMRLFPRDSLILHNEPAVFLSPKVSVSGIDIDYGDPLWRAHVCAMLLKLAEPLARIEKVDAHFEKIQHMLLRDICSSISMGYPGLDAGYEGIRAGALLSGGVGVCFVQRTLLGVLLCTASRLLACEVQFAIGRTLQHHAPHAFLTILTRPNLKRYVCDPAWSEPLTDVRLACFDAQWGHDRCITEFEGDIQPQLMAHDVDLPHIA